MKSLLFFILFFSLSLPVLASGQENQIEHIFPEDVPLSSCYIKEGDTLWTLFQEDWRVVAKINRVSPSGLKPGMIIMYPLDLEKAENHSPVPKFLPEMKDEEKLILVDLELQALGWYENGEILEWAPISSGKSGRETPRGEFRVLEKVIDHVSRSYPEPKGGAPMNFGLRFYKDYWIHEGSLPGKGDSKGCVRLMKIDAATIYHFAEKGTKVIVK